MHSTVFWLVPLQTRSKQSFYPCSLCIMSFLLVLKKFFFIDFHPFIMFILPCLGFFKSLESVGFIAVHQFGKFWAIPSSNSFSATPTAPHPQPLPYMHDKHLLSSHRSWALLLSFFFLCFSLGGFYCYAFKLMDFVWCSVESAVKLVSEFFISCISQH